MTDKSHMATPRVVILSSGGVRSLVAAAMVRGDSTKQRLTLVHVVDGRDNARIRLAYAQRQAEHHRATLAELDLPHLYGHGHGKQPDGRPLGALVLPQAVLAALEHAWLAQAERVVWPGSCNGEARALGRITEQIELCEHLLALEAEPRPALESPLAEMTDQQIIEFGAQLGVDWELAWSCLLAGEAPCLACMGCRRRKAAFDKAGLTDPIEQHMPAR